MICNNTWGSLMDKEHIIEHLRAAKAAHIRWVQKAKLLISGLEVQEDAIPVDSTECKFGKWFYSDGQVLNSLSNNPPECMSQIENLHFKLHDIYLKIFSVYFGKKEAGFFAKIFGIKRKSVNEHEKQAAATYYEELEAISKELIEEINRLERRLIAVSDEKVKGLI